MRCVLNGPDKNGVWPPQNQVTTPDVAIAELEFALFEYLEGWNNRPLPEARDLA
jgi:hypothetical protein